MQEQTSTYQTSVDELGPRGFLQTARFALEHYGLLGTVARYLLMKEDMRGFVRRAKSKAERTFRRDLLRKFNRVQRHVTCAHSPYQFVLMAEYLLELDVPGPLV